MCTPACTHTPAYMHRQAYGLHRHIHTDVGTHTETQDAIPLPYSEKETWIQILGSYQHRDTNTCIHKSLVCHAEDEREESLVG